MHISKIAAENRKATVAELKAVIATNFPRGRRAEVLAEVRSEIQRQAERIERREYLNRSITDPWKRSKALKSPIFPRRTWEVPIEERLRQRIEREFFAVRGLRYGAAGGTSRRVDLTTNPSKVGYCVTISENRNTYKGSYKGWAATEDSHAVILPHDWRTRVLRAELAVVDGLPTLDAMRLDAPDNVELFAAKWAKQGRGYSVDTHRGFIARAGEVSYHGDTATKALAGLKRKIGSMPVDIDPLAAAQTHGDAVVTLGIMRKIGACDYGIRAWCERAGFQRQFEAGRATVAELAEAYQRVPAREIRLAVGLTVRAGGAR